MATSSACGKVILLGEHGVVYGRPALAAGLAHGAESEFLAKENTGLVLHVMPWNVRAMRGDASDLGRALEALCDALEVPVSLRGTLEARVRLPGGGGLGSSAALGVTLARTLALAMGRSELPHEKTLAAALAWEQVFHGNPSGIDHTLAALGGAGTYSKSEGFVPIALRSSLRILVADSGERSPTREMVAQVARIHARRPENAEKTFDGMAALVRNGALALEADDLRGLGQLMDLNQALLASLLVSTERIEDLCRAARESGALGAKLTGGGGGGCVIALPGTSEREILAAWAAIGASGFSLEIQA